ncbi:unnamed protein product [Cladocopium goreaui]|uniref:Uncharacterized protein n=1 Tax=Cladocopium goreaui TaxID=2562237 RepID=A0A9P1M4I6_9DINO|nr:unnamed protein product [Cladocopium goreaui]
MAPKAAAKSTATVKAAAQKARKLQKAKASPKSKAKAVPDATGVVAVPDAQPITKAENQRLLNVLKYRADPGKNKKGENLAEAQKVLQNLTWFGQFAETREETATTTHSATESFLTGPKILEMNGLRWTDYAPEKQQELLEALLEESAATYNFQRATKDHAIPELVRYFYKEQESTTTAATNKDARTFHIHADMDSSQMSKASKDQVEIKIENPKKQEFATALKTANQGIKRLERLYNDAQKLSAQLQASLPEKHKEFQKQLDTFSSFFTQFRLVTAAAEKQGKTDLAEDVCEKEGGKLLHWCDQAAQHMDEVTLLNKRARGWMA